MVQVLLSEGHNVRRSPIAGAERAENLYSEANGDHGPVPKTWYPRLGKRLVASAPEAGPVQGIYQDSKFQGWVVINGKLYKVAPGNPLTLTYKGSLSSRRNPVSMIDNRTTLLVADGSTSIWQVDLASDVFSLYNDPTGSLTGAVKLDYIDTFILWATGGTNNTFGSTLSNSTTVDSTYLAATTGFPSSLNSLVVNHQVIYLFGTFKTEAWFDAGAPAFPFSRIPGVYFEHGCSAIYSIATIDISVYWLAQDLQGDGIVVRARNYKVERVSNYALEDSIRKMQATGASLTDAIAYTVQYGGHIWYVLSFPSGDQTWAYSEGMNDWYRWGWTDPATGVLHRDRAQCYGFLFGEYVVGDWQNGKLYALDQYAYADESAPIQCVKGFGPITSLAGPAGPVSTDGKRTVWSNFRADFDAGGGPSGSTISLRYSVDRGNTWGTELLQPAGEPGSFLTQPQWRALGQARDIRFELAWGYAGRSALNGAWVDATPEPG